MRPVFGGPTRIVLEKSAGNKDYPPYSAFSYKDANESWSPDKAEQTNGD